MHYLRYAKIHENAYDLARANPSDAGIDVKYGPNDGEPQVLPPGGSAVLETGLKFCISHGYMVEIMNRSSMASDGILVGAHVIDAGYQGEILINLHNLNEEEVVIEPGHKIAQAVHKPICASKPIEKEESELFDTMEVFSDRGEGGFGSTGV